MGWFTPSRHSSSRPGYARSSTGSTHSSSSRHHSHGHHSSTSHYKRRPRDGYIAYLYSKLRHMWHELLKYAKRHPYKVFFMVIMPLVSGGVLTKLARQFGVNLPDMGGGAKGLGGMMGEGSPQILASLGFELPEFGKTDSQVAEFRSREMDFDLHFIVTLMTNLLDIDCDAVTSFPLTILTFITFQ
ncbi:hypothetical protein P154DRAFT_609351 [Amniculicola lignicola CBS 123094]|uniref:Uncharacterized protein n=1 Tax=Amniculicola lignicola CBS 123094 TaxID=1392246 RepID=A0A6A5WEK5_9PLEO|nr:hypothetical protein P154DRAFT_609351 [Amniculicola lignicola CBS 123094]